MLFMSMIVKISQTITYHQLQHFIFQPTQYKIKKQLKLRYFVHFSLSIFYNCDKIYYFLMTPIQYNFSGSLTFSIKSWDFSQHLGFLIKSELGYLIQGYYEEVKQLGLCTCILYIKAIFLVCPKHTFYPLFFIPFLKDKLAISLKRCKKGSGH